MGVELIDPIAHISMYCISTVAGILPHHNNFDAKNIDQSPVGYFIRNLASQFMHMNFTLRTNDSWRSFPLAFSWPNLNRR